MRNKKRAIFSSIVLAVALSLSACASDDPDDGVDDTTDTGGVTTTIADMTSTTVP